MMIMLLTRVGVTAYCVLLTVCVSLCLTLTSYLTTRRAGRALYGGWTLQPLIQCIDSAYFQCQSAAAGVREPPCCLPCLAQTPTLSLLWPADTADTADTADCPPAGRQLSQCHPWPECCGVTLLESWRGWAGQHGQAHQPHTVRVSSQPPHSNIYRAASAVRTQTLYTLNTLWRNLHSPSLPLPPPTQQG